MDAQWSDIIYEGEFSFLSKCKSKFFNIHIQCKIYCNVKNVKKQMNPNVPSDKVPTNCEM